MGIAIVPMRMAVAMLVSFRVFVLVMMPGPMVVRMIVMVPVVVRMSAIMSMIVVRVLVYGKFRRRHTGSKHPFRGDVVTRHRQAPERSFQILERQTGIKKGPEHHIARNAGKAVEVQNPCHEPWRSPPDRRPRAGAELSNDKYRLPNALAANRPYRRPASLRLKYRTSPRMM